MIWNEIFYQNFFYLATYWIFAYILNCQIHIRMFIWSQIFANFEEISWISRKWPFFGDLSEQFPVDQSIVTVLKHLVSGSSVKVSTNTNFLQENDSRTDSEFKVLFWENNSPLYIVNFYSYVSKLKIPRTWNWLEYP